LQRVRRQLQPAVLAVADGKEKAIRTPAALCVRRCCHARLRYASHAVPRVFIIDAFAYASSMPLPLIFATYAAFVDADFRCERRQFFF